MIQIRQLTDDDMRQAMELKVLCWEEELAGKAENTISLDEEYAFWIDWIHTGEENNDVRLGLGAFEDGRMLGVAFSSFAEDSDIPERGVELNGLWVYPEQRGRGISLRLIDSTLDHFLAFGTEEIVIYCHHYAPSNAFYRRFGAQVKRQEYQMDGKLLVDIFHADIKEMKASIERSLRKHMQTE